MRVKRILWPTDLSDASMPALKMAAAFARAFKAELVLLFAVEPVYAGDGLIGLANLASVVEAQEKAVRASEGHVFMDRGDARSRRIQRLAIGLCDPVGDPIGNDSVRQ